MNHLQQTRFNDCFYKTCLFNRICVDCKQVVEEKINRYIVSTDEYGKLWSVDLVEEHRSNRVIVNRA